jgi:hypothetical protein
MLGKMIRRDCEIADRWAVKRPPHLILTNEPTFRSQGGAASPRPRYRLHKSLLWLNFSTFGFGRLETDRIAVTLLDQADVGKCVVGDDVGGVGVAKVAGGGFGEDVAEVGGVLEVAALVEVFGGEGGPLAEHGFVVFRE